MKAALALLAALLLLPVLFIAAAVNVLDGGGLGFGGVGTAAPITGSVGGIPDRYLALYQAAAQRYGISWSVLAGIGRAECDHGQDPDPSCTQEGAENSAGAGGPMQFLASTWATYGVDADHDGRADRWDPADAIYGAARYLRASGVRDDPAQAIFAYNHSTAYVDEVLGFARQYRSEAATTAPTTTTGSPAALAQAVLHDPRIGLRPEAVLDIRAGRIDPRLLETLLALSRSFDLAGVGPCITGHTELVAGTNRVSNHAAGRACDIGTVNGQLVRSTCLPARALALAVARLPQRIRPTEVETPWADLTFPGFFTDDDQDHVHLGYDA